MKNPPNKIILDTNLLLLLLVARTDATLLHRFKRVQIFTYQDIALLADILKQFIGLVTTPHVLAETSNFLGQAPSWQQAALVDQLKTFIRGGVEVYAPATKLIERDEFNTLGLTDAGLAQLSSDTVVLTVDYQLAGKINAMGGNALNFNHYRTGLLGSF